MSPLNIAYLLVPLCLAALQYTPPACALTDRSNRLVSYTKDSTVWSEDWVIDKSQPVSPTEYIQISLGLPQVNPTGLEHQLLAISDPSSSTYGHFLSRNATLAYLSPNPKSLAAVKSWLSLHHLSLDPLSPGIIVSPAGDWYDLNITVSEANALLGTNFTAYLQEDDYQRTLRATVYNIPETIADTIDTIQPTTIAAGLSTKKKRRNASADSNGRKTKARRSPRTARQSATTPPNANPDCSTVDTPPTFMH